MIYDYKMIIVGIDQSYQRSGFAIAADGELKKIWSVQPEKSRTMTEKRREISRQAVMACQLCVQKAGRVLVLLERTRLYSRGKISMDYIRATGALNACVVDACMDLGIPVYSIDTQCWKRASLGSYQKMENAYGVPAEKWLCVQWVIRQGFESSILRSVTAKRNKGTFLRDGQKWEYDHDAADAAGIAMAGFLVQPDRLKEEH